jgi:hypothetical protein
LEKLSQYDGTLGTNVDIERDSSEFITFQKWVDAWPMPALPESPLNRDGSSLPFNIEHNVTPPQTIVGTMIMGLKFIIESNDPQDDGKFVFFVEGSLYP